MRPWRQRSGPPDRWKELGPTDMSGFLEFGAGPMGVRITPDGRFYAFSVYRDSDSLTITDLGKDWWK